MCQGTFQKYKFTQSGGHFFSPGLCLGWTLQEPESVYPLLSRCFEALLIPDNRNHSSVPNAGRVASWFPLQIRDLQETWAVHHSTWISSSLLEKSYSQLSLWWLFYVRSLRTRTSQLSSEHCWEALPGPYQAASHRRSYEGSGYYGAHCECWNSTNLLPNLCAATSVYPRVSIQLLENSMQTP